ncbi:MAG: hypothetical protein ITD44_01770 [Candidatus Nitrotoga sp.]|nr:hypothetical protein [Candidatus Nitrotoga sp.]
MAKKTVLNCCQFSTTTKESFSIVKSLQPNIPSIVVARTIQIPSAL